MATINPIRLDQIKKPQEENVFAAGAQQAQPAADGGVQGLTFLGDGAKGKAQNSAVFKSLDPKIQDAIRNEIGNDNWHSPEKIAEAVNKLGFQATVGKEKAKFIEVTNSDGQKYRIWDIGSDGGIGTQDIDFNGALGDFKNDLKGIATGENHAATPPANITAPADTTKPLVAGDNEKKGIDDNEARAVLKLRLETLGYKGEELEKKLDELVSFARFLNSQKEIFSLI